MGSRANAVVIRDGKRHVYYSHSAAQTLDSFAFFGPDFLLAYVQRWLDGREDNPDWDGEWWLDNAFAEGGCCIDLDRRHLLLYGGDAPECDVLWQETYLKLLGYTWKGWTVEWSWGELGQIARYCGVTGKKLEDIDWKFADRPPEEFLDEYVDTQLGVDGKIPYISSTLSVTKRGCTKAAFTYESVPENWLFIGTRIDNALPRLVSIPLRFADNEFLMGSLHIDYDTHEIWLWRTWETYIDVEPPEYWSGWKLHDFRHDYRSFYHVVPHFIEFVGKSEAEYVREITEYVRTVSITNDMTSEERVAEERILDAALEGYRKDNPEPPMLPSL
jgi:hypothetical protein